MPPIKRQKRKIKLKQKKQITKRLMEISIKVDKYIYKHKPIPVAIAEIYLQEVISYEPLCYGDKRLLQVIEKLTRCLKLIIKETYSNEILCLADSKSLLEQNENMNNYMSSPVYSTADEDITQIPGENTSMNTELNDNNGKSLEDNAFDEPSHCFPATNKIMQTKTQDISQMHVQTVEIELVNSVIDLTLNDITHEGDYELCSQSILENVYSEAPNSNTNNSHGQSMSEIDKELERIMKLNGHVAINGNSNKPQNEVVLVQSQPTNSFRIISDAMHENNQYFCTQSKNTSYNEEVASPRNNFSTSVNAGIKNSDVTRDEHVPNINNHKTLITQTQDSYQAPKRDGSDKTKTEESFKIQNVFTEMSKRDNKSNEMPNSVNKKKTLKKNKDNRKKKGENSRPKTKKRTTKNKVTNDTFYPLTKFPKESGQVTENIKNLKLNALIRKTCIEEDLSWIENIKYVREIHLEENDPNLYCTDGTFWDNCFLPVNWNDHNFE